MKKAANSLIFLQSAPISFYSPIAVFSTFVNKKGEIVEESINKENAQELLAKAFYFYFFILFFHYPISSELRIAECFYL